MKIHNLFIDDNGNKRSFCEECYLAAEEAAKAKGKFEFLGFTRKKSQKCDNCGKTE